MKKILVLLAFLGLFASNVALASFERNLAYGSKGQSVIELQEFLTDQGVYSGPITGNFYSLTLKAVKAFQSRESIKPSGSWNTATRLKANAILTAELAESDADQVTEPIAAIVTVDWCPNLSGDQVYIPFGYVRNSENNCVQVPSPFTVIQQPEPAQPDLKIKAKLAYDSKLADISSRKSLVEAQMNTEIRAYDNYNKGQIGSETIAADLVMKIKNRYAPLLEAFANESAQAFKEYQTSLVGL